MHTIAWLGIGVCSSIYIAYAGFTDLNNTMIGWIGIILAIFCLAGSIYAAHDDYGLFRDGILPDLDEGD